MKKSIILLIPSLLFCLFTFGQYSGNSIALEILENRGEIYFKFKANPSEIETYSKILSIDNFDGKNVFAYANKKEFEKFLATGKEFSLVESYYFQSKALTMATTLEQMANWDRYPTYEVYVEMMQKFAADYPDICVLDTIGYSVQGRLLLVVKISDNVNEQEAEPEFLYTGMMHGDELIGGMLFLRLIEHILSSYGTDSQITSLVDNVQIFINPFANPDGTYYGGNNTVADSRRYNYDDIDLNRNYKDFVSGDHPDGNEYGVETVAFMEYAAERNFVMSANSHSGAELINYPYDTDPTLPADNDWWFFVCWEYTDTVHEYSASGYLTDQDGGVTNGYAWYQAIGTRQDYMNYYEHCREVTLELSTEKLLDAEVLPAHWEYNRRSLLNYLQQVTYGLRGIVTDSITGDPLEAMIYIDDYDFFNSHVYSFPLFGDYYRLLNEGDYTVTFSCEGYKSKSFDVSINNYEQTILDVQLANIEISAPTANFTSSVQNADCNPEIQFINISEASESTQFLWDFGDGTFSSEENPTHFYCLNGIYNVKLTAENEFGIDSIVREEYINISLPELEGVPEYIICETSGSVNVILDSDNEISWFENAEDEVPFQIGDSYTTPELFETTTYYVQELSIGEIVNGGEPDNSEGGEYITSAGENYLTFDCFQECTLQTVKVYAQGEGIRSIFIKTSQGEVIFNEDINIADGMQTVELNVIIPAGINHRFGCSGTSNLYRGFIGIFESFPYPYEIANAISIKNSNNVWWNDGDKYYAYFYDWQIKLPDCYSERTPLNIYVNQNPIAGFETNISETTVNFTNTSTAADSYEWDFGDETSSTETNPVHEYSLPGTYQVTLTANSDCGSDEYSTEITVTTGINPIDSECIKIFPNPIDDKFFIQSSKELINSIKIIDITGKTSYYQQNINSNYCTANTSHLSSGIYFLEINLLNQTIVEKLIKH
ncbi:MAG TPA: M14 family zinc carboxypeptidase [Bacteroidales bacterium]|nr:M14 family zinc carboxypeptidase [Bacteroidales bacterium]